MPAKRLIHLPSGKTVPAGKFGHPARPWVVQGRDGVWWLEREKRGDTSMTEMFRPNGHHGPLFLAQADALALAEHLNAPQADGLDAA